MSDDPPLLAVEPGYRNALRARLAVTWLVLTIIASIVSQIIWRGAAYGYLPPIAIIAIGLAVVAMAPERIYRRLRYRLSERFLQVLRGWMFHTDTIVPLVRVQHLDVVRGPVDKMFGISTLVIHTAGTHNSIVTVPGLAPQRAAEIRDIIREHVQTDFA